MTSPRDLTATEGVDEGSAQSTVEGKKGDDQHVQNPVNKLLGDPPRTTPLDEAAPAETETDDTRSAKGPGQELSAGEG